MYRSQLSRVDSHFLLFFFFFPFFFFFFLGNGFTMRPDEIPGYFLSPGTYSQSSGTRIALYKVTIL